MHFTQHDVFRLSESSRSGGETRHLACSFSYILSASEGIDKVLHAMEQRETLALCLTSLCPVQLRSSFVLPRPASLTCADKDHMIRSKRGKLESVMMI